MNAAETPEDARHDVLGRPATRCRRCGMPVKPPRTFCSRCGLADDAIVARKLAETDAQVKALWRHVCDACVAIASSLDTLPPGSATGGMCDRWLRALRQATRAVALVEKRLAADPSHHEVNP
jgi:hypothetical protein